jgi:hypothetical protein
MLAGGAEKRRLRRGARFVVAASIGSEHYHSNKVLYLPAALECSGLQVPTLGPASDATTTHSGEAAERVVLKSSSSKQRSSRSSNSNSE